MYARRVGGARRHGRAVVVVEPDVGEATLARMHARGLARMHARGARGVRVQNVVAGGASFDDIKEIAARIRPFGWHIQLFMDAADIVDIAPRLRGLPVPVVFDHMAQVHAGGGMDGDGFKTLLGLLESGRAWVKLSNAFRIPDPARARRLIAANPEHVVWGTDWSHLGFKDGPPDDAELLEAVSEWAPDASVRNRILVTNPGELLLPLNSGSKKIGCQCIHWVRGRVIPGSRRHRGACRSAGG